MLRYTLVAVLSASVFSFALPSAQAFVQQGSIDVQHPSHTHLVSADNLTEGAESFINKMANNAVGFLSNEALNNDQKRAEFRKLLQSNFDMQTLGRFALGRYWKTSSPAERAEYQKLFEKMIVDVYSSRFSDYKGQAVEVRSSRKDSDKDVTVTSFIVDPRSKQEVQVDWRVRYKDGKYRIVDVVVEGVSMAVTQRSDFSAVIQRGGGEVGVLIAHLKSEE